jgi:hypothetical protein
MNSCRPSHSNTSNTLRFVMVRKVHLEHVNYESLFVSSVSRNSNNSSWKIAGSLM